MVHDQALYAPLIFQAQYSAFSRRVRGFESNLLGKARFDTVQLEG